MAVKVIEASALGAMVFAEPEAEEVAVELANTKLIAPTLLRYELASICLKKISSHPFITNKLLSAFRMADRLAIDLITVDHVEVIDLAYRENMTTQDACYLWLARKTGAGLITLDKRLKAAISRLV